MTPSQPAVVAYQFGPFRLSVANRILERDGKRIQLTPKVVDTLFVLVENAPHVVTKEALMKAVWPDVNVVESGLTRNISALRKELEDGSEEGSYVETIPRRGYRFVAQVKAETGPVVEPPPSLRPRWLISAAGLALAASLALAWSAWRPPRSPAPVEPDVRIGEHLLYKLAPGETLRAAEYFEKAIQANPKSAGAHAGLSVALLHLSMLGVQSVQQIMPRAAQLAKRAVELDPNSSTAQYATACVLLINDWNFAASEAAFRRSLELDPKSVQTRLGYIRLLIAKPDMDGAQRVTEEALRLDPASPPLGMEYCRVFYYRSDFSRAEAECRKVLDREPGFGLAHYYLALSMGNAGRLDEARLELAKSGLMPGVLEADEAWLSALAGDRGPSLAVLESRRQLIRQGKVEATAKLLPAVTSGRLDEAFEALNFGVKSRAPELMTLAVDPRLEVLRADPRFPAVLRRIGFPPK